MMPTQQMKASKASYNRKKVTEDTGSKRVPSTGFKNQSRPKIPLETLEKKSYREK